MKPNCEMAEGCNKKKHRNFGVVSGEKEKKTGEMPNELEIPRGTLNTKRHKKT